MSVGENFSDRFALCLHEVTLGVNKSTEADGASPDTRSSRFAVVHQQ
jgi:hypothetical protein